jgi:hypothetical protein
MYSHAVAAIKFEIHQATKRWLSDALFNHHVCCRCCHVLVRHVDRQRRAHLGCVHPMCCSRDGRRHRQPACDHDHDLLHHQRPSACDRHCHDDARRRHALADCCAHTHTQHTTAHAFTYASRSSSRARPPASPPRGLWSNKSVVHTYTLRITHHDRRSCDVAHRYHIGRRRHVDRLQT